MVRSRSQTQPPSVQDLTLVHRSLLFRKLSSQLKDVNDHKWYESERAGYDIGFDKALVDWLFKHARTWEQKHSAESISGG